MGYAGACRRKVGDDGCCHFVCCREVNQTSCHYVLGVATHVGAAAEAWATRSGGMSRSACGPTADPKQCCCCLLQTWSGVMARLPILVTLQFSCHVRMQLYVWCMWSTSSRCHVVQQAVQPWKKEKLSSLGGCLRRLFASASQRQGKHGVIRFPFVLVTSICEPSALSHGTQTTLRRLLCQLSW
jgi:hypothetical protein